MRYCLLISCPPHSDNAINALHFAEALLKAGHLISRVFFYGDGAWLGNANCVAAQDEHAIEQRWAEFLSEYGVDSVVCIAAALKRGVLDADEAQRHDKPAANLHQAHTLSGLGQLIEASQSSDRLVSFQ